MNIVWKIKRRQAEDFNILGDKFLRFSLYYTCRTECWRSWHPEYANSSVQLLNLKALEYENFKALQYANRHRQKIISVIILNKEVHMITSCAEWTYKLINIIYENIKKLEKSNKSLQT